jgi:hypothetical protein
MMHMTGLPIDKNKQYRKLTSTVIYAQERTSPEGRQRIDSKLITDLSVRSRQDALRMLNWYALRMAMINRSSPEVPPTKLSLTLK